MSGARRVLAGKLGEFVQDHGTHRLVAVPWPSPTTGRARLVPERRGLSLAPEGSWKTRSVCTKLVRAFGMEHVGVHVEVMSSLHTSKGCGTSSVEMRAAAEALAHCLGLELDMRRLARWMTQIEPSDAIASDGRPIAWDYLRGKALSREMRLPVGYYVGGYPLASSLDTDAVDRQRPRYRPREARDIDAAFDQAMEAIRKGDLPLLGEAASLSAELNDRYFPKPELPLLQSLRRDWSCLGYWVAHSGVAFGLMTEVERGPALLRRVARSLGPGYRIQGFSNDPDTLAHPFLAGCGSRLMSVPSAA